MISERFEASKKALAFIRANMDSRRVVNWHDRGCAWKDLEKVVAWVGDTSYTLMPDNKIICDYGTGSARRTRTIAA